jgi:hypothetical protein
MFPNKVLPPSSGPKNKPNQAMNKKLAASCLLPDKNPSFDVFV